MNLGARSAAVRRHGPVIGLILELIFAGGLLVHYARGLWFFGDDWAFLLNRPLRHDPVHTLLVPHNGHWSTLPILEFRILWWLFGARHYLPYALVVIALHLLATTLLWVLLRRHGAGAWLATGIAGVLSVLGGGAQDTLWAFQSGFLGALDFGLLALLALGDGRLSPRRLATVWLLLIGSLLCSGVSLPMVAFVVVYLLLRGGWRPALTAGAVPAIVYLGWYAAYGHIRSGSSSTLAGNTGQLPAYVWTGLTNVFSSVTGVAALGPIVLVLVVVPVIVTRQQTPLNALALAGVAAAAVLFLTAGLVRAQLGIAEAVAGRYVYVAAVLLLPAAAFTVRLALERPQTQPIAAVVAACLLIATMVSGVSLTRATYQARAALLSAIDPRILGAIQLTRDRARYLYLYPDPTYTPVSMEQLAIPGVLAKMPRQAASPEDALDAADQIQVDVQDQPWAGFPEPVTLTWTGAQPDQQPGGCESATASFGPAGVSVPVTGSGVALAVRTSSTAVVTRLRRGAYTSTDTYWRVNAGRAAYVASVASGATLVIELTVGQSLDVCPVA